MRLNHDEVSEERSRKKTSKTSFRFGYIAKVQKVKHLQKYKLHVKTSINLNLVVEEFDPGELSRDVRKRKLKDRIFPSS